jgi:iron complex outermembrane receptor protein
MRNGILKFALLATSCIAGSAVMAPAAFAQDAARPAPNAAQQDAAATVEDIVVTAQKRVQNVQDVPVAITALGTEQLAATGATGTADLKALVPSLNVTTGVGGFGLPRIRGVGASGQGPGIENPVAVMVDDVYYGAAFGVLQSLFDTQQVAVLKGPQGTLFGRNATGGVIQITTRGPQFTPHGAFQAGYGNYDASNFAAFYTAPLSDQVAFSVSGQYENRGEGFGVNRFTGNDVMDGDGYAVRAKLLWNASPDTSLLLSVDANGRDASDPTFRNFGLNALGQDVTQQIIAAGGDPDYDIYSDVDPVLRARQSGGSAILQHDFGGVNFKSVTAYRESDLRTFFDPDGTTQARLRIDNSNFDKQFTQEINFLSDTDGPFSWVVGAFYMSDSAGQAPGRTTGTNTFAGNGYSDTITEVTLSSYSAFAEGTYAFNDTTNLTAGIRYTSDDREFTAHTDTYNGATNVFTAGTIQSASRNFSKPTWRLSLDHRFSDQVMGYASYNRGFRSGTYVPQATPIITLEPELIDAYEVGLKTDLFDRRVRANIAAFYYDQTNVQVQQVIAGVNSVYNAQGAEVKGIDADITWQVTNNLRLFGGFGYTDAHYTEFTNAIISVPYPLPAGYVIPTGQTCRGTFGSPYAQLGGNCLLIGDASGNLLQNTPKLTASVGGNLDVPTSVGTFTAAGNVYYNDGFVGTADERVKQGSYVTVDASLTWRPHDGGAYVRLWGKNLGDAYYRSQLSATNSGDNGTPGTPRTFGVTVGYDF